MKWRKNGLWPLATERLFKMSQSDLCLQADASMFVIGRAVTHLRPDELRTAQQEVKILAAVLELLADG